MSKTLGSLPVGTLVKDTFSQYYNEPIVWKIADKDHEGYPTNSTTLITDKIIKLTSFDGKESNNADIDRRKMGNNRYRTSNLRQWLNSEGEADTWWVAQNLEDGATNTNNHDTPPNNSNMSNNNGYNTEAGFMSNLSAKFKAALLNTTLVVAKNTVTDGGGSETVQDKIFLASRTEVGLENENNVAEGSKLAIFTDNNSRRCTVTAEAIENTAYTHDDLGMGKSWYWLLRTPDASTSHLNWEISGREGKDEIGVLDSTYSYASYMGLRPICNLKSDISVSDEPDNDGAYVINNAPIITSDKTGDLGKLTDGFTCNYSADDADADDVVTVSLFMDDTQIDTFEAVKGQQYTYTLAGNDWLRITNGTHTFKISASDGKGTAVSTATFTRNCTRLTTTLSTPLPADDVIKACTLKVAGSIPADAVCLYEVTNNANDPNPVWEDCTAKSKAGSRYVFTNKTAANGFAFNFRVTIERGESGVGGYISQISGGFE